MVEQRNLRHSAWLDHSVFQLLKTHVKSKKPHGWMGKFKSQIDLFQSGGEFLFKRMCTLEEWNIDAAPDPFTKFSFAKGQAKVKLGGVCWW